uniref:RNA helicase n=1 Tax=Albugo laibachii Nc14 TaxID=890382 RepID=F0WG78_9STRA|nr:DEAD/DEAH box RNA helicase putative [Albugo laibachii Nc14]|eukprot:CCA20213.1 DEAD/DEAH box RNA helicase putative [Albugo laibachii Nc14]
MNGSESMDQKQRKKSKKSKKRSRKDDSSNATEHDEPIVTDKKQSIAKNEEVEPLHSDTTRKSKKAKGTSKSKILQVSSTNTSDESSPYQQPPATNGSFKKSFYHESPEITARSQKEVDKYYQTHQLTISGSKCMYKPVLTFNELKCDAKFLQICNGFETPTPIQSQCWPILLSGRDIIGIAETGSGKTFAFTIPGLVHLASQSSPKSKAVKARMLVVAPTRELAMQTAEVINKAGKSCNLRCVCLFGGVAKHEQRRQLKSGVDVIVATPGRLNDLVNERVCDLTNVTFTVLDEADRMLDDGFEKDIRLIMSSVHKESQIAMFSATWPQSIQKLAHEFLHDPVKVTIGSDDLAASVSVTQIVEVIEDRARDARIHALLQKYHYTRKNLILIFVLYKKEADRVERDLRYRGWNCAAIHGDRSQQQRNEAVENFKSGDIPLLIATDVAARGLDIPGVEYVINYAFPLTIEDYVHRIGRTGRGGKKGIAHTFFTTNDKARAGELVNLLRDSSQDVPEALLKFGTHVKKKEHKLYGAFAKDISCTKKATKIVFDSD